MGGLILGLHAGINATAAAGDADGVRYCVQEERLTGEKSYIGFPGQAVTACLKHLGATPAGIAAVAHGSRFGPVAHCHRDDLARRLRSFHRRPALPRRLWAEWRMAPRRPDGMRARLAAHLAEAGLGGIPLACYDHHTTHGAAAYYGLRRDPATPYLVVTCDGFGDGACATVAIWQAGKRRELARTSMRDSLGLLYFWTTHAYGFRPHEDEYKLMGMAPYVSPQRAADPRNADLPRPLNQLIKRRDFWMPFAPAILASQQHTYIHNPKHLPSPHMMLAFHSRPDTVHDFIAAVHAADLTCRPQLIPDDSGCGLAAILRAYQARTGRAVRLNTSLNLHGQPIARTPQDALQVFACSGLRHMQLGPFLVHKENA